MENGGRTDGVEWIRKQGGARGVQNTKISLINWKDNLKT